MLQVEQDIEELSMIIETQQLPKVWISYFHKINIRSSKDLNEHKGSTKTYKELLKYSSTEAEILGLKNLLGVSDDTLKDNWYSNVQVQTISEQKTIEFDEYLQVLGLMSKFPKALKMKDLLLIRSETLGTIWYINKIQLLPYIILHKISMCDCRSRAALFKGKVTLFGKSTEIHPMDSMLALFHCCDNFLRQELLFKLSTCQMAIPLLLPNPHDGSVEFLLWAMRSIVKSWKGKNADGEYEAKEYRIVDYPAPIISFLRFGQLKYSKSKLINEVISKSKADYFFHWDCEGGNSTKFFTDGLIDMCCYLPSGKSNIDDFYHDVLFFSNLHGDARKLMTQLQFVEKISFMACLVLTEDDSNEEGNQIIKRFSRLPGGLILIFPELEQHQQFKKKENEQPYGDTHVLKLGGKNLARCRHELRKVIYSKLLTSKGQHKALNNYIEVAQSLNILVDEVDISCSKGKASAEKMVKLITSTPISIAKQKMLPLQGPSLWRKWASLDKESYRQLLRSEANLDVMEYSKDVEQKKRRIREIQSKISIQSSTDVMEAFLESLMNNSKAERHYFIYWLRMFLDDYSRLQLPQLRAAYYETRGELLKARENYQSETEQIKKLRERLKEQSDQLIESSFGVEHLFREMGQIYEAGMDRDVTVPQSFKNQLLSYPQIVVELMEEGFPVELMDGDASHIPIRWVLAILDQLKHNNVKLNKIFVISVLGIQSSGKSTLLNTLFGLHFNVSAGRCTRGAYFQLLPLDDSLREQTNCDYILIVDTEGLRAPELLQKASQKHDNELATFIIGIADLTIINIFGESPGILSDMLNIAVHAFIRMNVKHIDYLSCHFVHQNVPGVLTDEKGKFGRQKWIDNLDSMAKIAAEVERCKYSTFRDVIYFDHKRDVTLFPTLWKGDPPMSPVNPGFCNSASMLKQLLLTLVKQKEKKCTIETCQARLTTIWKAVLYEKHIFTFINSLEVTAYQDLNIHLNQWSLNLNNQLLECQIHSANSINSCEYSKIESMIQLCIEQAQHKLDTTYLDITKHLESFFTNSDNAHILIQWRKHTETGLLHLLDQHKNVHKKHCNLLGINRSSSTLIDEILQTYHKTLYIYVAELTIKAKKQDYSHEQRQSLFNEQWKKWVIQLSTDYSEALYTSDAKIDASIIKVLENIIIHHGHLIVKRLNQIPMSTSHGYCLHLDVGFGHLHNIMPEEHLQQNDHDTAKVLTQSYLKEAEENVKTMACTYMLQDHSEALVHKILMKLLTAVQQHNRDRKVSFKFTPNYEVDIVIIVARFISKTIKEIVHKLRIQSNPTENFNKLKPTLLKIFESQFTAQ